MTEATRVLQKQRFSHQIADTPRLAVKEITVGNALWPSNYRLAAGYKAISVT